MDNVVCFTSATYAYLDRVRVLVGSLRRHQPSWRFVLVMPDEAPPGFELDAGKERIDAVVGLRQLGIPDLNRWVFCHDVVELSTAVKGSALSMLLAEGADKVIYLDPDIALFADLRQVEDLLDQFDVLLTPHLVAPAPASELGEILDHEAGSVKHGIYNLGFLAVANHGDGPRFARWWRDRLLTHCYDEPDRGIFTDQRWCNLATAYFPSVHVLRDPGFNVASWNLGHRPMTLDREGQVLVCGRPLRFFHFTKVTTVGEKMIERYLQNGTLPIELLRWYRAELEAAAVHELPPSWWAYGRYDDGTPIPRAHRRRYRDELKLQRRFLDPFASGRGTLQERLFADGGS